MRKLFTWARLLLALGVMVIVAFITLLVVYLKQRRFQ
jgi:hypothetical protein